MQKRTGVGQEDKARLRGYVVIFKNTKLHFWHPLARSLDDLNNGPIDGPCGVGLAVHQ